MKKMIALLLTLVMVFALVACAAKEETPTNEVAPSTEEAKAEEPKAEEEKENVTLTYMCVEALYKDVDYEVFDAFTEETGIEIEIISNPNDMHKSIVGAKIATNELPDILHYFNGQGALSALKVEDYFFPITGEACLENVNESLQEQFNTWKGEVYGFPFAGVQNWGIIYNKQVFDDLGLELPTTIEELEMVCEKIKEAGITPIHMGAGDAWPTETWIDTYWGAYIDAKLPNFWDDYAERKVTLAGTPEVVECLQKQLEFYNKGYYGEAPFSASQDEMYTELYEGTAAMHIFGDHIFSYGIQKFPDFADKVGLAPLSIDGTGRYAIPCSEALYISKNSEHVEEALMLFEFLARPENVEKRFNEYQQASYFNGVTLDLIPQILDTQSVVQSGNVGRVWFDLVPASYGSTTVDCIPEMLLGNMTPEEVLAAIDAEIAKNAAAQGLPGW